ncbi:hypothetical protein BU14_0317s0015 [Porphyra umbilicalis]|uniref:Uncharacterized protein n=1 Tax=Porphyra umbilicalis TaxID=2786 RepID=A0A1X6NZJ2_PORUM|nr:hypothetical protein BU14_0317s0015 [Porphyra umbilicalis]|eukprot:OSX73955.1 hypothetical protein BU14_0317s0015 [Porphyra umbilicalis]
MHSAHSRSSEGGETTPAFRQQVQTATGGRPAATFRHQRQPNGQNDPKAGAHPAGGAPTPRPRRSANARPLTPHRRRPAPLTRPPQTAPTAHAAGARAPAPPPFPNTRRGGGACPQSGRPRRRAAAPPRR